MVLLDSLSNQIVGSVAYTHTHIHTHQYVYTQYIL